MFDAVAIAASSVEQTLIWAQQVADLQVENAALREEIAKSLDFDLSRLPSESN